MAGIVPSFITGANAKLKIGNLTLAFATDLSYQITTNSIPVRAMGMIEVAAYEPVSYTVSGTFSVVRYTRDAASADVVLSRLVAETNAATGETTQVLKSYIAGKQIPGASANGNSIHQWNDSRAGNIGRHVDPGSVLKSLTFDIEVFSKQRDNNTELILKLRDCRISSKSGALTKKGLMVDNFSFNAILTDNDDQTFVSNSGNRDLR
jgi:hypothetical protein